MTTLATAARTTATTPLTGPERKAYLIGGGIGSLAAAAFMIRDGGILGRNIAIFEALSVAGGKDCFGAESDNRRIAG